MNIVHLTPGTGNFHCGSCLRDNLLVKELRRRGHDVVMVPLYLPLVTDDDKASPDAPVFLGGINLYLQEKASLFQHAPRWLERLFDSEKLLLKAANRMGMTTAKDLGQMTLGSFKAAEGRQAKEWRKLVDWIGAQDPKPDIVSLSNGLLIGIAKTIQQDLGIPVIASLQGEDGFLDSLPEPYLTEAWEAFRKESENVARFIAVSEFYAESMRRRLQVSDEKVAVVLNGIDSSRFSPPESPPDRPTIGYLARLHHGKGLHTLVDAFILLKGRGTVPGLQLRVAGSKITGDDQFIAEQVGKLQRAGLDGDIEFRANIDLDEKIAFLRSLSVLSVPATYGEAFGLYLLEAHACGVPVVQPRHGAFPEVLGHTEGGVICEPDDAESLADALQGLLLDEDRRRALGRAGEESVRTKFSVARMAEDFEKVCATVAAG